jgi:Leucine-rich repeat (LRR) protein
MSYMGSSSSGSNWSSAAAGVPTDYCTFAQQSVGMGMGMNASPCDSSGQLTALYLHNNNALQGTLPDSISALSTLVYLSIGFDSVPGNAGLNGTIPSIVGSLTALTYLSFQSNRLTGTIPPSFGDLVALKELHLENNQLGSTVPSTFSKLTLLTSLCALDEPRYASSV